MFQGEFDVTIYYEDTDLSGYVYHPNYLKYFERARTALLTPERLKRIFATNHQFVVSTAQVAYLKPVRFGDTLRIRTTLSSNHPAIMLAEQHAFVQHNSEWIKTTSATIEIVTINARGAPTRLPQDLFAQ
jgi:acyl-CoA thioester hydrolase